MESIKVLDKGFVELQDTMGNDLSIVQAARVSTLKESKGEESDKKLLKYLLENNHSSPLEMVEYKFRVKCPLFIRSQWMRHRTGSYNEVSRRYTSEDIEFYIPARFRKQADENKQGSKDEYVEIIKDGYCDTGELSYLPKDLMEYIVDCSLDIYELLLHNGVAKEQARMVLPQNLYTMFIYKTDLKNLLHFLDLRNSSHAQWEMQEYAKAVESFVEQTVPWTYEIWKGLKK